MWSQISTEHVFTYPHCLDERVQATPVEGIYFSSTNKCFSACVSLWVCVFTHVYPCTHFRRCAHSYPIIPREHPGIKHTHTSYIFPLSHCSSLLPTFRNSSSLCLSLCTYTCACFAFPLSISALEAGKHDLYTHSRQCATLICALM